MEYSRLFWYFIQSNIICKINGSRCLSEVSGKGLEVPCEYIFTCQQKPIEKLISVKAAGVDYSTILTGSFHTNKRFTLKMFLLLNSDN